jgi:hypothetical protein
MHSGDFSEVLGFAGSIEDGEETRDFDWPNEEIANQYTDTLAGMED